MQWIMLIYRLPRSRTTARKVALWRKLKKLGVYAVQDSVCVLPDAEKNLEMLEWIAAELREDGGEASVWEVRTVTPAQEKVMKDYFLEQVNVQYRQIVDQAPRVKTEEELKALWRQYNGVKAQDYLRSPLSVEARAACEARAQQFMEEEKRE